MCTMHADRLMRNGDPEKVYVIHGDDDRRFESYVDRNGPIPVDRPDLGPCWLCASGVNWAGYAQFIASGSRVAAHRWSYERFVGPIPDGLQIDHLCFVRNCVNPSHLEPVTAAENTRRRSARLKLRSQSVDTATAR